MTAKTPPGIIGILLDPNGSVVTTHGDFDQSGRVAGHPGSQAESQEMRVRQVISTKMIDIFCCPIFGRMIPHRQAQDLLQDATRQYGFRLEFIRVGYDDKPDVAGDEDAEQQTSEDLDQALADGYAQGRESAFADMREFLRANAAWMFDGENAQ